jgi:pimeloyl-ACP methyl ester carboxylesterase
VRFLCLLACLLAACHSRADDFSLLKTWFAAPEVTRGPVPAGVTAVLGSPTEVVAATTNVWAAYRAGALHLGWDKELPPMPRTLEEFRAARPEVEPVLLKEAGKEMPMLLLAKGERGTNGWPLFLTMHGGGQAGRKVEPHGSRINTQEWQAQVRLFQSVYPPGLYLIPRMADDNDGRWWFSYCQAIYDRAIRCAILFRDADPNRVYVMGISEGGYAAYRLGAQMADRWAGSCALAAAEPLETSPPENFRNLPFRCAIGERDTMFDRIGLARRYFAKLEGLQTTERDTNAYVHVLEVQKDRGHGIDYRAGPEWIAQFTRNPWPRRVAWTSQPLHGVRRRQMYWLALDQAPENGPVYLTAGITGNTVTVTAEQPGANGVRMPATGLVLRLYLNDHLLNLDEPVQVLVNGQSVREAKVPRRVATLARSLSERGDPCFTFPAELELSL